MHSPTTKRKIKIPLALIGRAQSYNKPEKNPAGINRTCTATNKKVYKTMVLQSRHYDKLMVVRNSHWKFLGPFNLKLNGPTKQASQQRSHKSGIEKLNSIATEVPQDRHRNKGPTKQASQQRSHKTGIATKVPQNKHRNKGPTKQASQQL